MIEERVLMHAFGCDVPTPVLSDSPYQVLICPTCQLVGFGYGDNQKSALYLYVQHYQETHT